MRVRRPLGGGGRPAVLGTRVVGGRSLARRWPVFDVRSCRRQRRGTPVGRARRRDTAHRDMGPPPQKGCPSSAKGHAAHGDPRAALCQVCPDRGVLPAAAGKGRASRTATAKRAATPDSPSVRSRRPADLSLTSIRECQRRRTRPAPSAARSDEVGRRGHSSPLGRHGQPGTGDSVKERASVQWMLKADLGPHAMLRCVTDPTDGSCPHMQGEAHRSLALLRRQKCTLASATGSFRDQRRATKIAGHCLRHGPIRCRLLYGRGRATWQRQRQRQGGRRGDGQRAAGHGPRRAHVLMLSFAPLAGMAKRAATSRTFAWRAARARVLVSGDPGLDEAPG